MDFVIDKIMQWGEDASETGYQSLSAFITNDDAIYLHWEKKKIMLLDLLEKKNNAISWFLDEKNG